MKNNYMSQLHFISKHLFTLLILALLFIGVGSVSGQAVGDYGTRNTGTNNWNTAANWIVCVTANSWTGATVAAAMPTSAKNVWIRNGATYTVNTTATCLNLNIQDGGTLTVPNNTLTVSGTTTVGGGTSGSLNITSTTGTKTFTGLVTVNAGATWNNSANEAITFRGGITNNGTFNAGTAAQTFDTNNQTLTGIFSILKVTITGRTLTNGNILTVGTALIGTGSLTQATNATLNIRGTSTIAVLTATNAGNTVNYTYTGAAQTIHPNNYYNLTLSGSGTKALNVLTTSIGGNLTLSGTLSATAVIGLTIGGNVSIGSATTFNGNSFAHNVAGDWTNNGTFTPGTGTLTMTGSGKTIGGSSTNTFYNMSTSGTASVSTTGNITVSNNFNIGNGSTFNTAAAYTLTVGGTTTIGNGGILNLAGWGGTKTFTGPVNVNSGGTWNNSGNLAVTFKRGITNDGTFTSGSGPHTFDTNAQALAGTINLSGAAVTVNGINLTNNGSLSLTENLQGWTGTLSNATTGTINISGNQTSSIGTLTNQGVINIAGSYGINTSNFTNTGTINLNGTGYIASITNNAGGTVNLNASHNIQSFNNSTGTSVLNINALTYTMNTLTATAADNTVNYSGAGDQTIKNVLYSNLTVSGSGTKTFTGNTTIAKTFTNNGVIANLGTGATHSANSYYLSGTEQSEGSWGGTNSGANNINNTNFTATTGLLNVATGACIAGTWKGTTDTNWNTSSNWCGNAVPNSSTNVIIPNVTYKPTITAAAVCNNITIGSGSSLIISGTNSLTISGNFTNNGTFTANNSTVTFNGSTSQSIAGTTFYNLTVSGAGTKTFAATTTISNTFTNSSAVVNLGTGTHTANSYYLGGTPQLMGSWGGNSSVATNKNTFNFADATGILNVTNGPCTAGYWKGTTDTDWNTASNWCDNVLPTSATDVIIPASAPNKPIIGAAGGLCKNITIESGATLTLNVVTNLFVYGNWTNNGSFSASGIGSVIFSGTTSQVIGGSTTTSFYNLTIQNSAAVGSNLVTLNKPATVTGTLLLVDGNLVTNATNLMTISKLSTSAIMGGSSSSFIDGPVIWSLPTGLTTGTTYNFPVGDNTAYLPLTLVNPSTSAATTALVEAFNTNSGGTGNGISNTEYWQLTTTAGFTNSSVSLGKGSTTVYPYDLILGNTAQTGAYTSLSGTTGFYDITNSSAIGTNRFFALGASATPKINFVPVILGGFFYIYNFGPSNEQTFILNGTSLTEGITVSAPAHFEISLTSGTGFVPSIVLPIVSGNKVNTTPIYIRLKAGLTTGTYTSEKVTMTSTGATAKEITCEGTVFATTPTIITSGGRNCPPNNTQIQLGSSGDNIDILYWTGSNNYYSQSPTPLISPADATYDGTYTVTGSLPTGGNLINNGDFELQNVGFSSSYAFVDSTSIATYTCHYFILGCEGTYTVVMSPFSVHGYFLKVPDHSNPGTFQMVINGATTANVSVWSQTVKVVPNSTYQFTYWLQSVNLDNPSKLQLFANNQPVGTIFTASSSAGWNQYFYNWNSGSNTDVVLDLRNQNIVPGGNDFAFDDIVFRTVTQVSSSINVTSTDVVAINITTPTPTVTAGTNVTFSATPTNGGTSPDYVWTVKNGANTTSYPSTKSNSFSYVPIAGDVISCQMTSNSTCITGNPAPSNEITMNVTADKNLWIGTNSTVWSDPANWTRNVPASGDNVEFATTINNSVAAKNDLHVDYNRIVGNLINNASGKNLIIPADKEIVVNNSITLTPVNASSTHDQIQIKSDSNPVDASRLPNGSLIFPNATNVNGTVEMYSKAYIDINADINSNQRYFWQYFGIPVETITAEPTLYGAYVRKSNESGIDDDSNYYWTELSNSSTLNAFDGFEICQPEATTYTFKGLLVNRSLNLASLPYTVGAFYPGEHLLANPYTAAIDVNKMNFGTNVEAAVYLYNTGSFGQWDAGTGLGDNPGQYQTIPKIPAGNNGLPREVPSMSSMLIKVTDANNTGISFNYNDVIKKNETIQRVKSIDAISNTDLVSTMIDLTGLHYSDRMWIFTEPSCTRNFDNGWDGRKILGSSLAPQIFAIEPDGDYQVNSVSDMHNTNLAFQAGDEVEYTLKFTHENIQRQYAGVYLVDLVENKTVDVSQDGSTYTFATAQSDAPAKRFKILTRPYEKGTPDKETQVKIFTAPGRVFVHNLSTFKGECTLYDIAGRAIKNAPFAANAVTEVLNSLTPGAYVVNTITNGEKVSKRVIVQ